MPIGQRLQFLEFTFDLLTGELSNARETVRLQPQPAAALRVLLSSAGELVTRDALKQAIWPDTVVEADQGLNFCIRQIRMALGDEADGGRFIETLPRRGYRFIPEVRDVSATTPVRSEDSFLIASPSSQVASPSSKLAASSSTIAASSSPITSPSSSTGNRVWFYWPTNFVTIGILMTIAIAVTAFLLSARTQMIDVALLPLASRGSSDPWALETDRLVTDALVESLTNLQSPKLGVHGPASTSVYVGSIEPHTEIGRKLAAQYVLSGGVRMSDSTLFVQAIRVRDGRHVYAWRQPIRDRSAAELAQRIATDFAAKLTSEKP